MIKAVPRTYSGTRFRSTLEADWAHTLDSLGIAWEYEPEAFQLPSGAFYRPDFYLPEVETWFEVKGPHDHRIEKTHELAQAALHGPLCAETVSNWPEITIRAWEDRQEGWAEALLSIASPGPTQVVVERPRFGKTADGWPRVQSLGTVRLKKRIQVDLTFMHLLISALGETGVETPPCCGYGWSSPWRLVVVGRAPRNGGVIFEPGLADQGHDISIIRCASCKNISFFEESGIWHCRWCKTQGKVYASGQWRSGDGEIEFRRAPR